MKVKEESEKVGLKLNIQKTKTMASSPNTSWQIDGEIELPYEPAIPLLGIHTKETRIERDMCTPMFIAALFYSMINKLDGYQDHNKWCNYTFSDLPEITHKNVSLISNAIYLYFWSSASSWLLLEAKKTEIMDKWADGWMEGWMEGWMAG